jgi:hypothetical protein
VEEPPTYTAEEVDRAVEALSEATRFAHAQEIVSHAAPGLQRVLDEALRSGGWFGEALDKEIARAVLEEDPEQRLLAVRSLLDQETQLGMLVGVAVGLELARELASQRQERGS